MRTIPRRVCTPLYRGLLLAALAWSIATPAHADPVIDSRFGVVQAYEAPEVADDIEVGWERLFFSWPELQPQGPGDWNPAYPYFDDATIQRELDAGRELVGLLINTPPWASDGGGYASVPRGLYLPYDDPGNTWGQFVAGVVRRYAGRIDRWIVWNEPDIWDATHAGYTWSGSVQDYYRLVQVAYLAARDANSNARIHLAGFTYWWDVNYGRRPYLLRFLDVVAADPTAAAHDYYFDVATVHAYFQPEQVYDLVRFTREALLAHGIDKPVWVNETNAPPSDDPQGPIDGPLFPVRLDEQPAFIIQAFAMALAAGAERVELYKMIDEPQLFSGEPYGLLRHDGSRRPAVAAFDVVTDTFAGFTEATLRRAGPVNAVRLPRGQQTTTVLWNRGRRDVWVQVSAAASGGVVVDASGRRRVVRAVDGVYTLRLPGALCTVDDCIIGGPPRLLIEAGPTPGDVTGLPAWHVPPLTLFPTFDLNRSAPTTAHAM